MQVVEREVMPRVFTIDRRHFSVYRRAEGKPLSLITPVH